MIRRVLAIAHDGSRTGAPLTLLNLLGWARTERQVEATVIVLADGPLVERFAQVAEVRVIPPAVAASVRAASALDRPEARPLWDTWVRRALASAGEFDLVLASSAASLPAVAHLPNDSAPVAVHLHELDGVVRALGGAEHLAAPISRASRVIVPTPAVEAVAVRPATEGGLGVEPHLVSVHREPVDPPSRYPRVALDDRALVVGCGTVGWRKGTDLFVALAATVPAVVGGREVHWAWVGGNSEDGIHADVVDEVRLRGLQGRVHLTGEVDGGADQIAAADLLVMTSREDPYPLVVVEAALVGTPVAGFRPGTELLAEAGHDAARVEDLDVRALADEVGRLLADREAARRLAADLAKAAADATTPLVAPALWAELEATATEGRDR